MKNCKGIGFVAPDGGWGYVIAVVIIFTYVITFMPMATFGIVYGPFLQELGDEATYTALVTGIYLAVQWFAGLVTNPFLQNYSYRKVGLVGASCFFTGSILTIFVTDLHQFILSFAVLQAFGYGLMLPSVLTAYNLYFDKKRAFVYNVLNILVIACVTTNPALATFLRSNFGFRGTLLFYSGFSLNCFPLMLCLQPVKWHMVKLKQKASHVISDNQKKSFADDFKENPEEDPLNSCTGRAKSVAKSLDVALLADPVYVNIAFGVALCIAGDYSFLSFLPLVLDHYKIYGSDSTLIMTIFYASDVFGRVFVSVLVGYIDLKCRNIVLTGALLMVIVRIGYIIDHSFWWITVLTAILGSLRCTSQTMFGIIFGELYPERFVAAFSFFMVFSGIISLTSGFLIGVVKSHTQNNEYIVHFITLMYGMCAIPWIMELLYFKLKRNFKVNDYH